VHSEPRTVHYILSGSNPYHVWFPGLIRNGAGSWNELTDRSARVTRNGCICLACCFPRAASLPAQHCLYVFRGPNCGSSGTRGTCRTCQAAGWARWQILPGVERLITAVLRREVHGFLRQVDKERRSDGRGKTLAMPEKVGNY